MNHTHGAPRLTATRSYLYLVDYIDYIDLVEKLNKHALTDRLAVRSGSVRVKNLKMEGSKSSGFSYVIKLS